MNLNKFIGIPHYFGKSSYEQCDCAGLAKLFYAEHGYNENLDDNIPIGTSEDYKKTPLRMLRYLIKHLDRVDSIEALCYGDIVVTKVFNELHLGIYLEYQRVLAMEIPVVIGTTKSCIYKGPQWIPHFVRGFRRKEQ
jgi:hypothetical protein